MQNLAVWSFGWRSLRLTPRTFLWLAGLGAGQLISILLLARIFNITLNAKAPVDLVIQRAAMMIVLSVASNAGLYYSRILGSHISNSSVRYLRVELLDLLYLRSYEYHARSNSAALHATLVLDSERVQKFFEALLGLVLPAIIVGIGIGIALVVLNPPLAFILVITAVLLVSFNHYSLLPFRRQIEKRMNAFKAYSRDMLIALQLITLTRVQSAEVQETARQTINIDRLKQETELLSRHQALQQVSQNTALLTVFGILLVLGSGQIAAGQSTLGNLLAFNVMLIALRRYLQDALGALPILVDGYHGLESLHVLISHAPLEPYSGTVRYQMRGSIQLRDVTYAYTERTPILRNVDLTLAPHSVTTLIGRNGSGKTTLVNLLLGLYRPLAGSLLVDEHPYEELDMSCLRRQIGVLTQDPQLFDGTIWENITYGLPEASMEQVLVAADMASADEFIQLLPQVYQTLIGERGVRLSGGQRQRIALARVLLRKPKLLIMDEPTNHLDASSAAQLIEKIMHRENPPTTLIISHDRTLTSQSDQSYVMSGGRLLAMHASA